MSVFNLLSAIAARQVLADGADALLGAIGDRFSDNSRRLVAALDQASGRAWRALELALGGPYWFGPLFTSRDERQLQAHITGYLGSLTPSELPGDPATFRRECLLELRSARRVKLVPGPAHGAFEEPGASTAFARYADPEAVLRHDEALLAGIADVLRRERYPLLARYVELRPARGEPLLVQAARFFFRRAVELDGKLAAALTVQKLDGLQAAQRDGFASLEAALSSFGDKVDDALAGVGRVEEQLARQADELRRLRELVGMLVAAPAGQDRLIGQAFRETEPPPRRRSVLLGRAFDQLD